MDPYQQQQAPPPGAPPPADPMAYVQNLDMRLRVLEQRVGGGFFKRAFSIWGHWFVVQLIIGTVVWTVIFVIALIFGLAVADFATTPY